MSATASLKQRASKWSIGARVLLILAGFLAITIPRTVGVAASLLFGWLLVLSGAGHLVFALHTQPQRISLASAPGSSPFSRWPFLLDYLGVVDSG